MTAELDRGYLGRAARALLAFQFCETEAGVPSVDARLGATLHANHMAMLRAFMKGGDD